MSDEDYQSRLDRIRKTHDDNNERFENQSAALAEKIGEDVGFFGKILGAVTQFFQVAFQHVWSGFYSTFAFILDPIERLFTGESWRMTPSDLVTMLDGLVSAGYLDKNDVEQLSSLASRAGKFGPMLTTAVGMLTWVKAFGGFVDVIAATGIQRLNRKYSPTVPNPESIARTSFIAPEWHDKVVDAMKRSGLSEDDIKLVFVSMLTLESPDEVMQLFWRGELSKDQAINRMSEAGYTATRTAELMQLWERLPSLGDIVRYLGKEAFEPAMIKRFGLLEDYPRSETEKWAAKQGLDPMWAEKEWIAHWRDIGVSPVLEGLHRHTKISGYGEIDAAYVDSYLRLIEIPGPIREIIEKTSYNVYTRVDARRMHDMGVLKDEDLVEVYEAQGYDKEHAINMALFTIRYNSREGKEFTRSDIEKAYEDGDMNFNESGERLVAAGFTVEYAMFLLQRVDIEKERAKRLDATEIIKAKYLSHLVNEPDTRTRLLSIGFGNPRASELIERWTAQLISNAKLPSKTDLDKMMKHKIIDAEEYKDEMRKLGYAEGYIVWYLELATFSAEGN